MIEQRRAVQAGWSDDDMGGKGELFHLLVDSLWDHAIFATDPEGVVKTWTPGAERLLGYSEGEIVGQPVEVFFEADERVAGLLGELLREVVEKSRTESGRWLARKDGSRVWSMQTVTPLRGEMGDLRGFAWMVKDRTEWNLADRERREAEGRNAAILNSALDCIIIMDQQGRVLGFNPAAERTFGYAESAIIGRELAELIIPPNFREQHYQGLAHYLATGEGPLLGRRIEVLAMRADGSEFPVELAITPIISADSTTFTAYLRDLTDRRNREREVAERRRLAEFGRDVGLALTARTSLEEMLDRVARETVIHLDGAFARVWTLDESGETLELKASAGMYTHIEGNHSRIPVGKFKIGRIAEQRRPHLTNAVVGDPSVPSQEWARREKMVAFAGYPLVVDDRLVGVWALFARHPLSLATLEAMESVATGIAGAIERKRVEEGLAEQKEWLQVTIDSIGDAVISTDGEGRVVFMNPVAEALTGWSRGSAMGRPLEAVFHIVNEYTRLPAETPVKQVLRDGVVVGLANHTVVIARDGRETAIEDSAAPIKDASGKVVGVVMVFQDATERRKHERALRESEERFRQLADSMPQLAWMADETGSIGWYNRRWYDYTGTTPEEMIGWGWQSVHDPAYLESVLDRFRSSLASGQPFDMVFPLRGADGIYRPFLTRAMPLRDGAGRVVQWFGTNTDISEQRELEEALRAAGEEAAEANRSKDRFLAVLSHELRTPLNPILLAASSMLERPPEPSEIRPALEMIRQNVMLQARLIDDLLDVMRIVRGKMPLHWEVVDAHRLIRLSTQICQSEVFGKEIRLKLFLEAADHHINADPARFQQVIWNLVKNAVKFTPSGGTISVKSRNEGGDHLVIEVTDTGIGIEAEVLPLIFDPFQQGETKITRKYGGLGLGLAICRGIVDAHGGTLVAASAGKDRGSTFRIELKTISTPAIVEERPIDVESATPPPPVAGLKLLLVEDEPATIRLMARLMRGLGHEVTTASTVSAAFDAVEATPFDLIVSDIGLPDGTGLDLMRRTVALRGPVKAIALTGYGMEEDIRRSREAGFTAHLTKPIDFAKLEALIRRVVG